MQRKQHKGWKFVPEGGKFTDSTPMRHNHIRKYKGRTFDFIAPVPLQSKVYKNIAYGDIGQFAVNKVNCKPTSLYKAIHNGAKHCCGFQWVLSGESLPKPLESSRSGVTASIRQPETEVISFRQRTPRNREQCGYDLSVEELSSARLRRKRLWAGLR